MNTLQLWLTGAAGRACLVLALAAFAWPDSQAFGQRREGASTAGTTSDPGAFHPGGYYYDGSYSTGGPYYRYNFRSPFAFGSGFYYGFPQPGGYRYQYYSTMPYYPRYYGGYGRWY